MSHVHVSDDLYLAVCNFESEGKGSKKGEHVALVKFCDENGDAPKYGKGFNPGKLKALLTSASRDKLIALCDEAIALADAANAKTVKPAASRPAPPVTPSVVYFTFDGTNQSAAIIDANIVRQFVAANANNDMAQIHVNGAWHPKANWSAIGFALPPAPPAPPAAPVAPPAPVSDAPAAPVAPRQPTALEVLAKRKLAAATA